MTEDVEVDTRQIYLIPTEGPDGMQNTEVGVGAIGQEKSLQFCVSRISI